jgi:hypothetical protein
MSEVMEDWESLAKRMRAAGVLHLEQDQFGVTAITLSENPPPAPPPEPTVLDSNPLANAAALEDMRVRCKAELVAEAAEERDRYRFAASEGMK